jgi:hypothetical protein
MNTILIKRCSRQGQDTKIFRAYTEPGDVGLNHFGRRKTEPLGVTASSTADPAGIGAAYCAAKAFLKYAEPHGDIDEIRTRIKLIAGANDTWDAQLQPPIPGATAATARVGVWKSAAEEKPDAELIVLSYVPDTDDSVWLAMWDGEKWCDPDGFELQDVVTHWMELPEPPKVEVQS